MEESQIGQNNYVLPILIFIAMVIRLRGFKSLMNVPGKSAVSTGLFVSVYSPVLILPFIIFISQTKFAESVIIT